MPTRLNRVWMRGWDAPAVISNLRDDVAVLKDGSPGASPEAPEVFVVGEPGAPEPGYVDARHHIDAPGAESGWALDDIQVDGVNGMTIVRLIAHVTDGPTDSPVIVLPEACRPAEEITLHGLVFRPNGEVAPVEPVTEIVNPLLGEDEWHGFFPSVFEGERVPCSADPTRSARFWRHGGLVYVSPGAFLHDDWVLDDGDAAVEIASSGGSPEVQPVVAFTLPEGFRPAETVRSLTADNAGGGPNLTTVAVTPDGKVRLSASSEVSVPFNEGRWNIYSTGRLIVGPMIVFPTGG